MNTLRWQQTPHRQPYRYPLVYNQPIAVRQCELITL